MPPAPPRAPSPHHARGLALTGLGGLALSFDIPLIRLADGEPWTILLLRSTATFLVGLLAWAAWRRFGSHAPAFVPGRVGLAVAALYGLGSVLFVLAVFGTSTANLVFILTLSSAFAALLSWAFLGERPAAATLLAMAAMLCGVAVIVGDGVGRGHLLGDLFALASTASIACAITLSRSSGRDMGLAALAGVLLPLLVALPLVASRGAAIEAPGWILFNGALVTPLAFFCLASGPRYLSAPEVAMFYLLETVLAPVWVWLIFAEAPTRNTMIGGAILVAALVAHSLWQLGRGRRRRATAAPRHPA